MLKRRSGRRRVSVARAGVDAVTGTLPGDGDRRPYHRVAGVEANAVAGAGGIVSAAREVLAGLGANFTDAGFARAVRAAAVSVARAWFGIAVRAVAAAARLVTGTGNGAGLAAVAAPGLRSFGRPDGGPVVPSRSGFLPMTGAPGAVRILFPRALLLILLAALAGCAGGHTLARPIPAHLPFDSPLRTTSLAPGDAWLRHHLMLGQDESALSILAPESRGYPADDLLRALQEAVILRKAGDHGRSNERLEWAEQEAERRHARSVTRTAGAFILNDRVLSYTPSEGERALIAYYRMVNHLALADPGGAAVEARRLSVLVGPESREERRCSTDGMLQYVAGLVFEAAAEHNDALVAFRRAQESFDGCGGDARVAIPDGFGNDLLRLAARLGMDEVADSAIARYGIAAPRSDPAMGEVVVLVERGFVAHLTEEAIHLPILEDEIEGLESGDAEGIGLAAAALTARLLGNAAERSYWGMAWDDHPSVRVAHALRGAYVLRLAWPGIRRESRPATTLRLLAGADTLPISRAGDISSVAVDELDEARRAAVGRLVVRSLTKYLVSRELEKEAEKKGGEFLGFVAGRLANLAAHESERPDVRSWSLLPDEIGIARLTLPEGIHDLRVETRSATGETLGVIDLGPVPVRAGRVSIVSERVWSEPLEAPGAAEGRGDAGTHEMPEVPEMS